MWTIYSNKWGALEAECVYPSATIKGAVTALEVTTIKGAVTALEVIHGGALVWRKVYLMPHDITAIVPPQEV